MLNIFSKKNEYKKPKKIKFSQNYQIMESFVNEKKAYLENDHLSKWIFMKHRELKLSFFSGRKIDYGVGGFEGSPRNTFWSQEYIHEYLINFCKEGVEKVLENSIRLI